MKILNKIRQFFAETVTIMVPPTMWKPFKAFALELKVDLWDVHVVDGPWVSCKTDVSSLKHLTGIINATGSHVKKGWFQWE